MDERKFIEDHFLELTPTQIARNINRTVEPVLKYIKERKLLKEPEPWEAEQRIRLLKKLYTSPYWQSIKEQLVGEGEHSEIKFFEDNWVEIMQQFRENVLYTEELDIVELLRLKILVNRAMRDRLMYQQEISRLKEMLEAEYAVDEDVRDVAQITNLEGQLAYARAAVVNYTKEFTELSKETKNIAYRLKATRDERIKRVEGGAETWTSLLSKLEDRKYREELGREIELMKMAADKAHTKLSTYHEYLDGNVDRPLLSVDTISEEDKIHAR